jgi:hypothetical protein
MSRVQRSRPGATACWLKATLAALTVTAVTCLSPVISAVCDGSAGGRTMGAGGSATAGVGVGVGIGVGVGDTGAVGVTASDGADAGLVPATLVAVTVNV